MTIVTRARALLGHVARGLGFLAGGLIAVIAVFLLADTLSRHFFSISTGATEQIVSVLAAFTLAAAFPYGLQAGSHIMIEVIVTRYPAKLHRLCARFSSLAMAAFTGIIAAALWTVADRSLATGAVVQSTSVPIAFPQTFAVIALVFMTVLALLDAIVGPAAHPALDGEVA
ncbi:TRAP transporter small permease [Microbacterium lushaniae]|uniref:TRAP transporter small permease n=1 Tax=Microbacterium lushaniae TaxID=2614639 RepID=A0A5J6L4G7_9MICO|nr:TRAP transporter small permease [Microbacterium lushaniae]QEW03291.1 TRAP transporter small permease [Microbacterium lushaniae]